VSHPGGPARSARHRVLLVEDEAAEAHVTRSMLGERVEIEHVPTLSAAGERLDQGGIDAVLLDLGLPDCRGVETARRLCERYPDVPVVILTGPDEEALGLEALHYGAEDCLVKGQADGRLLERAVRYSIQRKAAGRELRESEAALERAQAVAQVGSWVSGVGEGAPLEWSKETYRIFGLEEGSFDGRLESFFALIHPDDVAEVRQAAALALVGQAPYNIDHRILRPDGSVRWVHEQAEFQRAPDGRPLRMFGTVQDITDRKLLEDRVRQFQKIEAIGRLAGGVAHDFNNLLGVISGFTDLLARDLEPGHRGWRRLEQIRKATDRAAALTRQLLAFSRRQVLQPRVLDLNTLVTEVQEMLKRVIGEHIAIVPVLSPQVGRVKADPGQLEQVIVNLAVNARDAMPGGGKLILETDGAVFDDTFVRNHAGAQPGPYVVLSVSDNGHGMDAEVLSHVFEPFFTTKEAGKGTGLGLATVYGIVKQSGGYITVYSELGRGTTVKVYLPRVEEDPQPLEAAEAGPPPTGSETILLLEDEGSLREIIREVLEEAGYRVLTAADSREALPLARAHGGPIHILVTDVVMPGLGGREIAEALARERPSTRVLYISGYTDEAIGHHNVLDPGVHFLQKPFSTLALLRKVREVLDSPRD
jgi:two-component system, cell cycle sensor histidine kinase and response regulator CckA